MYDRCLYFKCLRLDRVPSPGLKQAFRLDRVFAVAPNKRLALRGMREGLERVGGECSTNSAAGKGTTVRAEILFNKEKA